MDPLSVTASVIAVVQAAQSVLNGVKKFRDAPQELVVLQAELFELIGISKAIEQCIEVISSREYHEKQDADNDHLFEPNELLRLEATAINLKHSVEKIGKVVESSRDSKGKLNRILWLRKNAAASREFRKTAARQQMSLAFHLTSLTPMQLARHDRKAEEQFEKLQQLLTAYTAKNDGLDLRSDPLSHRPLKKWDNQSSLPESLPPYSKEKSRRPLASSHTAQTRKYLWYTALKRPHDASPDSKPTPSQDPNQFPTVPSTEPLSNDDQPERMAVAIPAGISEPCAMLTGERESSSRPTNESLVEEVDPITHGPFVGSTQMPSDSPCLLEIPNTHTQGEANENAPGSVGGVSSTETLPPPEGPEKDSTTTQGSEPRPQTLQESSKPAVVQAKPVITRPRTRPVQRYWYRNDDLRNDHLDMYACSCPRSTTIRPPRWMAYLFGGLTLAFCLPFLTGVVCCNAMCQAKPKRSVRVDFQLPRWLTTSMCLSILYWDSTCGLDRFLQWRRVREVEDAEAALAIETGDIHWLQRQVTAKRLLPFDVLKGIGDPLAYSLTNIDTAKGFKVTIFLWRSGFHSLSTSYQGCNASYIARLKMKTGIDYEQRHLWSILQDIANLDQNPNLNYSTLLHEAALRQTRMGVREVLAQGMAGIDDYDGLGFTALHWCIKYEDVPQVKALLKAGADVTLPTKVQKWSPLHLACQQSSLEISTALLEGGAKLEQEDSTGQTPLHHIPIGNAVLVDLLLTSGADAKHVDFHGNTVLHSMAWKKQPYLPRDQRYDVPRESVSTIKMLTSHGISMDATNARGYTTTMHVVMRNPSVVGLPDAPGVLSYKQPFPHSGWTVLHYAAYYWDRHALLQLGFWEANLFFASPGFDPDAPDHQGWTALEALEYRMFAADEERSAGVARPTREEVRLFVGLLQECRTTNWEEGDYLETKQRLQQDGSWQQLETWRRQYGKHGTGLWEATDVWWRDMEAQPPEESGFE